MLTIVLVLWNQKLIKSEHGIKIYLKNNIQSPDLILSSDIQWKEEMHIPDSHAIKAFEKHL